MNALKTIGWGLYLASSWTWCIGMFLPIILLERYGWQGFFMFAIPNVIGCAAFGYVLKTPERSKDLVAKYGFLMGLFSIATIAFHALFIVIMLNIHNLESYARYVVYPILFCLFISVFFSKRIWMVLGSACWITSLCLGLSLLPTELHVEASRPWQDVLYLLPITTFGFLLCPYLDPTFHRALQESPSRHCFGVFGITFAVMIGITCAYSETVLLALPLALAIHLLIQATFSIIAHQYEGALAWKSSRAFPLALLASVSIAMLIAAQNQSDIQSHLNDYLRFFVFYGLIFPGLVVIFMWTGKAMNWLRISLFGLVALCSLPLLESAYIGEIPWLAIFPVAILLSWAFVEKIVLQVSVSKS